MRQPGNRSKISFRYGCAKFEIVLRRNEPGDVVQHQDAFDFAKRLGLGLKPCAYERRGGPQEPVGLGRMQLEGQQKIADSHQVRGHGQRSARRDNLDPLPGIVDLRFELAVVIQQIIGMNPSLRGSGGLSRLSWSISDPK